MQMLHPSRGSIQQYLQEISDPDRYNIAQRAARSAKPGVPSARTVFTTARW